MIDLPSGRQAFDFDCGAKALQLVIAYYGIDTREDDLMQQLKCSSRGTPVKNMISFAEKLGFKVISKCDFSLDEVKQYIDKKQPVIVLLQAWAEKYMTMYDWRDSYDNGHYVVIVGYFDNIIVFEDPASFRKTWLTEEEFLTRWHDRDPETKAKLERFGMVLTGKDPAPAHITAEHMG